MINRHNLFADLFDNQLPSTPDTRAHKQTWKLYSPGQPAVSDYSADCSTFAPMRGNRHSFIRPSHFCLEQPATGWARQARPILTIWVVIIQIAPGWHFELPFFSGPKPYLVEPSTDAEVAAVISKCVAIGGYDEDALRNWLAAYAAAIR